MYRFLDCEFHERSKKRLFCKEPTCLVKICQFCAQERHYGHTTIELVQLHTMMKSEGQKQAAEKRAELEGLKEMLDRLDIFSRKLTEKQTELLKEEKKTESMIDREIQKLNTSLSAKRDSVSKLIKAANRALDFKKEELTRDIAQSMQLAETELGMETEEEIKKFLFAKPKFEYSREEHIKEMIHKIELEVNNFDNTSLRNFLVELLHPGQPPASLNISRIHTERRQSSPSPILLRPALTARKRSALPEYSRNHAPIMEHTVVIPSKSKLHELEDLDMTIKLRKNEIQRLNQIKEKMSKSNSEVMAQIEHNNRVLAENLQRASPSRNLNKSINLTGSFFPISVHRPSPSVGALESKRLAGVQHTLENIFSKHKIFIKNKNVEDMVAQLSEIFEECHSETGHSEEIKHSSKASEATHPISYSKEIVELKKEISALQTKLKKAQDGAGSKNKLVEENQKLSKEIKKLNKTIEELKKSKGAPPQFCRSKIKQQTKDNIQKIFSEYQKQIKELQSSFLDFHTLIHEVILKTLLEFQNKSVQAKAQHHQSIF